MGKQTASSMAADVTGTIAQCRTKHDDLGSLTDESFPMYTAMITAHLRAMEASRPDAIVVDPFAKELAGDAGLELFALTNKWSAQPDPTTMLAVRTRSLDEALAQRDPKIQQIVILAAGLDTRAYRLETLKKCHVLEVDMCRDVLERKQKIMREANAPLMAKQVDYIVADLTNDFWQTQLIEKGFNPKAPTFWCLEGLLYYLTRDSIVKVIKTIDALSAPTSVMWLDMCGHAFVNEAAGTLVHLRYGENDPLHGVLSLIDWDLELLTKLGEPGTLYGREWQPMTVSNTNEPILWFFVRGTKPHRDTS
ncbi:TPA: hypothetical protein N0F65_010154 [Lagenidium giganteum]|uniref:S-adenosyl-L-methionine-dependent methyltransferase n=1 Tax=Lagenidium giganteum TaxID=4803 RepID=A0AAV2Z888_9STRA|nr:TPA: hypothetical protein N0F65_010154 [Lagenidium giganteum]